MSALALSAFNLSISLPIVHVIYLTSLKKGSSLSVEKHEDVIVSSNGIFSAGFYQRWVDMCRMLIW